jgi:hypothetical protein
MKEKQNKTQKKKNLTIILKLLFNLIMKYEKVSILLLFESFNELK